MTMAQFATKEEQSRIQQSTHAESNPFMNNAETHNLNQIALDHRDESSGPMLAVGPCCSKMAAQMHARMPSEQPTLMCVESVEQVSTSQLDSLRHGALGYGTLRYVTLRYGTVRYGTLRYGTLRYVTVRYGTLRYVTVRYGTLRYVTVRYGTLRYGTVRYGTLRYGTLRYVTVRYVTVRYGYVTVRHAIIEDLE
jgi:hypothetical protein